ncbi:hypothetical protein GCM10027051_04220 [Niabella terrae]
MSLVQDILTVIPQRSPFVMVDSLEHSDALGADSSFLVKAGHIFVEDGVLGEPALIENIAQTAAAHTGYLCQQEGRPVPAGFIGAVQQLRIEKNPVVGESLRTRIRVRHQVFNATIIEGDISVNGRKIASCEMKIFVASQ